MLLDEDVPSSTSDELLRSLPKKLLLPNCPIYFVSLNLLSLLEDSLAESLAGVKTVTFLRSCLYLGIAP